VTERRMEARRLKRRAIVGQSLRDNGVADIGRGWRHWRGVFAASSGRGDEGAENDPGAADGERLALWRRRYGGDRPASRPKWVGPSGLGPVIEAQQGCKGIVRRSAEAPLRRWTRGCLCGGYGLRRAFPGTAPLGGVWPAPLPPVGSERTGGNPSPPPLKSPCGAGENSPLPPEGAGRGCPLWQARAMQPFQG
jgi:hypothetical protein